MSKWRPEQWCNPYSEQGVFCDCYEQGATNLLGAIRKQPIYAHNSKYYLIPDDPKEDNGSMFRFTSTSDFSTTNWDYTIIRQPSYYEKMWQTHKATKVIEIGYFCPDCGSQVIRYDVHYCYQAVRGIK